MSEQRLSPCGQVSGRTMERFPAARATAFADFARRYAGRTCWVVGRGPTEFDYAELGRTDDPVFFINDAVCMEGHAGGDTYFFAHDAQMLAWLNGPMRSTAVLPMDGKLFQSDSRVYGHRGNIVFYRTYARGAEALLGMGRKEIAAAGALYTATGTIHSLLHFLWFCGFKRVMLIGCDGLNAAELPASGGYDLRLANASGAAPALSYGVIRRVQDRLLTLLGLEAVYLGTPACRVRTGREVADEAYDGVRRAAKYLREAGVPRAKRVEILQAYEADTITFRDPGGREDAGRGA